MTETASDTPDMETKVKIEVTTADSTDGGTNEASEPTNGIKTELVEPTNGVKTEATESTNGEKTEATESTNTGNVQIKNEEVDQTLLDDAIIQQIHYYFGDMNLLRDRFLQGQIKLDDGWVPLEVLLTFNRLKDLSTDPAAIIAALRKAPKPLIEISEDETKLRRSPAFPLPEMNEEWRKNVTDRTVYSKGFPTTGVSLDELLTFFKQFGPIDNLQKRTYIDKKNKEEKKIVFKGSVFVTFQSLDDASRFLSLESVKFGDTELIRKSQTTYWDDKKIERDEKWGRKTRPKDDKSKKQSEQQRKKIDEVESSPRGCILYLSGFPEDPIDRDAIREKITELGGDVAYITYNRGDQQAYIRLQGGEETPAAKLLESLPDKVVTIGESDLAARVLEGEEETEFLKKSFQDRDKRRGNNRGPKGKNFYRGRKRQGGGDNGPPSKRAAVAAE